MPHFLDAAEVLAGRGRQPAADSAGHHVHGVGHLLVNSLGAREVAELAVGLQEVGHLVVVHAAVEEALGVVAGHHHHLEKLAPHKLMLGTAKGGTGRDDCQHDS
eukprot:TRINITY_DN36015_c0_g1_i2.p1 TRINITY_DN36015_c0_g1~~TRINITY_DN36015_c0_g1_i2.p1  ORF type:complete len:104 (-),score=1.66 TRINITY_DN36015_c0_g1_i2:166-477(-)